MKQKLKNEIFCVSIRKVDGGFIILEEYLDDDKPDIPHVCTNIDQVLALIDKFMK